MADITPVLNGLAEIVGREHVSADRDVVSSYAVDDVVPKAVVFPADTEQVSEIVKLANRENLAILPWGSGSKITKGNPPRRLDLVLSTSRMNRITDIDAANLTLTAQAGVKLRDIQAQVASEENRCYLPLEDPVTPAEEAICSDREHKGCFLPIDAPFMDSATIGGVIAGSSSGPRRLLYGLPRDLVLGVRFVAANGDILGTGGKTVKNVSGYDISKLMVGSAGTLGIICEITLRLLPLPEQMETLLFPFSSISKVSEFVDRLFESPLLPAAVEVMNRRAFEALDFGAFPDLPDDGLMVAVALEGFKEPVDRMRKEMPEMASASGASGERELGEEGHRSFWRAVSNMIPSALEPFPRLISAQLNYPISQWKQLLTFAEETLASKNLDYTLLCHAGNGLCIVNLLTKEGDSEAMDRGVEALNLLFDRCLEAGGNLVFQRIPSDQKQKVSVWGETKPDLPVMRWIKEKLDPLGLLSPGRFVGGL